MIFQDTKTVKVSSIISGSTNRIAINGITSEPFTPETAQIQINKVLDLIGKSVITRGMTRTRTEEAIDNG